MTADTHEGDLNLHSALLQILPSVQLIGLLQCEHLQMPT